MRNVFSFLSAALVMTVAYPSAAAKKPALSPLQIQELQTRQFEGQYDVVFASVISVLQDSGYRIDSADKYSGFIRGTSPSKTRLGFFSDKKDTPIVSVFIEKISEQNQNVRLNFVLAAERNYGLGTVSKNETPVLDQAVYTEAFEMISKAVFLRTSLRDNPAKPATPKDGMEAPR